MNRHFQAHFSTLLASAALNLLFAASCGSEPSTPSEGSESASSSSGQGGSGSSSSSSSSSGTTPPECTNNADCASNTNGPICDPSAGICVACLAENDPCPAGNYCDPTLKACVIGCADDSDCGDPSAGFCDVLLHACAQCLIDTDCTPGTVCANNTCVPGCSNQQPCLPGLSCCAGSCYELDSDLENCGSCANVCPLFDNAESTCTSGACAMGACKAGHADCDGDTANGCEQNTLADGPCLCVPGQSEACYGGAPGTQDIGVCKAGIRTCAQSGTAWGECLGQVLPSFEQCANNIDEDCDGTADNAPDLDGDGFSICEGDCCELAGLPCNDPSNVNPGAFEVTGNGVDDDCDAATGDSAPPAPCSSAALFTNVSALRVAQAMDICQMAAENPTPSQRKWGLISAVFLNADGSLPSASALSDIENKQSAVLGDYGTGGIVPTQGPTMAGLSTGYMRDQNDPGYLAPNGGFSFGRPGNPPAVNWPPSAGCNGNCPAGAGANDSINARLKIRVPTNFTYFTYDLRFFSAEYWNFACSPHNDLHLALLQSATFSGLPLNIALDGSGSVFSVNSPAMEHCTPKDCYGCFHGSSQLAGTGMELADTGAGTSWFQIGSSMVPGEIIQLDLMVFDVGDGTVDSLILLDNFRWSSVPPLGCY